MPNSFEDFFRSRADTPDYSSEEISFMGGRVEENVHSPDLCPPEYLQSFMALCASLNFPYFNRKSLKQFSFQSADNVTYKEDKIMSLYDDPESHPVEFRKWLSVPHQQFSINLFLSSHKIHYKFYELDFRSVKTPILPAGSQLATSFGIGMDFENNRRDIYFTSENMQQVADHFQLPIPLDPQSSICPANLGVKNLYGLSFRATDLKPLKLKLYYYPRDPLLKTQELYTLETSPT